MRECYYTRDGKTRATREGYYEATGRTLWRVFYNGDNYGVLEEHTENYYKWARGLHGNAPSGTPYASFRATRNGKRVIITT